MRAKNKKYNEDFETNGNSYFISIYLDMITSTAWKQLSAHDIVLYINYKIKYHRKVSNGNILNSNKDDITFPKKTYGNKTDQFGYEDLMNQRTFFKSIDHLIELGFIRVVENRWTIREPTIYGFSDMWKYYGTEKFKISDKDRRAKGRISEEHKKAISMGTKNSNFRRTLKVKKIKKKT